MGAWGTGILQNDDSQDGLVDIARDIERSVAALEADRWPKLLGAIGLLVQFSPFSFSPDSDFHPVLIKAIERYRPAMSGVSEAVEHALAALLAGDSLRVERQHLPFALENALHERAEDLPEGFLPQKTWAKPFEGSFAHPMARDLAQEIADRCVTRLEQLFADEQYLRDFVPLPLGDLALLLIVSPISVEPIRFEQWRTAWRRARYVPDGVDPFCDAYEAALERAFEYGITRFADPPTEASDSSVEEGG